jgi:hypothetical protein
LYERNIRVPDQMSVVGFDDVMYTAQIPPPLTQPMPPVFANGFDLTGHHPEFAFHEKNALTPWQHEQWCIPDVDADFVAAMEDILDLYAQPYDPTAPQVCFE